MASPLNFINSPGTPCVLTDLFLPILANLFLITLVSIIEVFPELANFNSRDVTIAAKDICLGAI